MIAGVDEVNRSPVIGPIIMAEVAADREDVEWLEEISPLRDSKKLTKDQIKDIFYLMSKRDIYYNVDYISPKMMDNEVITKLEYEQIYDFATEFDGILDKVYLDMIGSKSKFHGFLLGKNLFNSDNRFIMEKAGDDKWSIVSLASVVAKFYEYQVYHYYRRAFDFKGSGEPHDYDTLRWICEHSEHKIVRQSWATWKRLKEHDFNWDKIHELLKEGEYY